MAQQYTNFSTKDGLPSNQVYTIIQDAQGFMWFLTDKGMVKYNGKTFKTYTTKEGLPNNDVWDAFSTPDGKVWYMSKSSQLGYIKNDSVLSFSNENKDEIINPIYSTQIDNDVYFGGPNKIFKLKNNVWKHIKTPENKEETHDVIMVFNAPVAYLKVKKKRDSLFLYDKNHTILKRFSIESSLFLSSSRGQINEKIFFWTSNQMYMILNLETLELKRFKFKDEIGVDTVKYPRINLVGNTIQISGESFVGVLDDNFHVTSPFFFPSELNAHFGYIDAQNTIWISTFANGVYKLPYIKQHIDYAFEKEKIQSLDFINNQLIVGVYNKGFYKYNETEKTFSPYIESIDYVFGVNEIKEFNTCYFLKNTNIIIENKQTQHAINFKTDEERPEYVNSYIKKVIYFNNKLYGIYSFGIYELNPKTFHIENDFKLRGLNDFVVFNSRLIIATNNGLKELKNDKIINVNFNNQQFTKAVLSVKTLPDDKLLINTDGFGSFISNLNDISALQGSNFLIVQDAYIKEQAIWLATNTGVLHFEKQDKKYQLKTAYTIDDGLPNSNINKVFVNDSSLIVGTNNGLASLPIQQKKESLLFDVFIEKATYNTEIIDDCHFEFYYKTNNALSLTINSIDFSETAKKEFSYKLQPIQTEWTTTSTPVFNFNNLPPNNYVFNLKSGAIVKQLEFSIKPLWWQKGWAKSLLILFFIGILGYAVWYVSKQTQLKKNRKLIQDKILTETQLKALRSQMNPHFVFNSLAAIQYYINNNEIEASEIYLVKFSKLIRQFFELSKETEITLDKELKLIKSYLDIEKIRFKDKFQYHFNIDENIEVTQVKLPTMLLQPIVENAINHGIFNKLENGNIYVNIVSLSKKSIKIEIIDDGVGFINTQKQSSLKIKSSHVLKDRLKYLNKSEYWKITYSEEEYQPELNDKGNKSTFIITQL